MATTLFYAGNVTAKPQAVTTIDASQLEQSGLGAKGILALVGDCVGGIPVSATLKASQIMRTRRPEGVRELLRSGNLFEAGAASFQPSADEAIPAGALEVVLMKTNQATQSSKTFSNGNGSSLLVVSEDYGAFTEQISIQHIAGTEAGSKQIIVTFEAENETADNVGGDDIFTLTYRDPGTGWDVMRAQVLNSGIRAYGSWSEVGLEGDIANLVTNPTTVRVSSDGADTRTVTIYGLDAGANAVRETLTLNGAALVTGVQSFSAVYGVVLSAPDAARTVTVAENSGGFPTLVALAPLAVEAGVVSTSAFFVANATLVLEADGATTRTVQLWGKNQNGIATTEIVTLAGTTPVVTAGKWSLIEVVVLENLEAARTLTISGTAAQTLNSVQDTIQKAADYFNARQVAATPANGFTFTQVSGLTTLLVADLDLTQNTGATPDLNASVDIVNPAEPGFTATLKAMLDFYLTNSQRADATRIAFAPLIYDVAINVLDATAYTMQIDGFTVTYTSGGGATAGQIQAGLAASANNNRNINTRVTVAAQGASAIRVTATTPKGFVLTESDANLTPTLVQSTAGVGAPPDDTTLPEFLVGGSEGTSAFADYQTAFNLLKQLRVNTIIPLSADPAVHAALEAHLGYRAGLGKSEADGLVGLEALDGNGAPTGALATKTSIKEQIIDINSRHVRACPQSVTRFNTLGERTEFPTWMTAVIGGAMQAGAPLGLPLTRKYADVLDVSQDDATWNPANDAHELIQAGAFFLEMEDGVGFRWVRNVTTWLKSNNLAFVEAATNEAVNFAAYEFRNHMESVIGQPGFAGTVLAAKGTATVKLDQLGKAGALVAWRSLGMVLVGDQLQVSVEMAPPIGINFVPITIHLVLQRVAA